MCYPSRMTEPTNNSLIDWIRAAGRPVPDLSGASFFEWLCYWYGGTDGQDGRAARQLMCMEMEPDELGRVLLFEPWRVTNDPSEYDPLWRVFQQLVIRWVDDLNEEQSRTTERQA